MIKLIQCKTGNDKNLRVEQTDDVFTFVLYKHAIMATISIDLETLKDDESITIKYSRTYQQFIQYPNIFNSRDTKTFYENYYDLDKELSIIIAKCGDEYVILVYGRIEENLTQLEIVNEMGSWIAIMQKHLPEYAESYIKKKTAKVELMKSVSPLDSISYLEKQVDILSSLVMLLIQDKEPEWLPTFQTVLSETTSVTEQNVAHMIEKLYSEKMRVRDLQVAYFNAIKDNNQ